MNFPDSLGKEQNVLTTGTEIWIGQGLVDKAECSPFIWTFFGYLRCTDSLSELESIGRSNLTWPAKIRTNGIKLYTPSMFARIVSFVSFDCFFFFLFFLSAPSSPYGLHIFSQVLF